MTLVLWPLLITTAGRLSTSGWIFMKQWRTTLPRYRPTPGLKYLSTTEDSSTTDSVRIKIYFVTIQRLCRQLSVNFLFSLTAKRLSALLQNKCQITTHANILSLLFSLSTIIMKTILIALLLSRSLPDWPASSFQSGVREPQAVFEAVPVGLPLKTGNSFSHS